MTSKSNSYSTLTVICASTICVVGYLTFKSVWFSTENFNKIYNTGTKKYHTTELNNSNQSDICELINDIVDDIVNDIVTNIVTTNSQDKSIDDIGQLYVINVVANCENNTFDEL